MVNSSKTFRMIRQSATLGVRPRRWIGYWLGLSLAIASTSTVAEPVERYHFKLTYGSTAVCKAYVARLVRTKFHSPPICRKGDLAVSKEIVSPPAVAMPPHDVGRLAPQVSKTLAGAELSKSSPALSGSEKSAASYAGEPAARNQSRAILSGQPLKYYSRFDPEADVDNDGVGDEIMIWRNSFSPCGDAYPHAADEFMITPVYLLILDSKKNIDAERTRLVFSDELHTAIARARGKNELLPANAAHSSAQDLLGQSYGIFKYHGLYYTDVYYPKTNSVGENEPNTWSIGVFLNRNKSTSLICEIEETDIRSR
jgi:hypothetical protein